jgi:hypothetical protein
MGWYAFASPGDYSRLNQQQQHWSESKTVAFLAFPLLFLMECDAVLMLFRL